MSDAQSSRLADAFKRLASTANTLRIATNEFSAPISEIDRAIQKLNLGVVTWQKMAGGEDQSGAYWRRDVGYASVKGLWGLAVRSVRGHHNWPDDDIDVWAFDEAPSSMRIEAVDKLPDLLEELIKNAEKTAKKLKEKTVEARELADAVKQVTEEMKAQRKERR